MIKVLPFLAKEMDKKAGLGIDYDLVIKSALDQNETIGIHMETKKLYRTEDNQVLAGVAGGLGEYFEVDPVLIRLLFVLLTVFGGSGVLIYIVLWLVIPQKSQLADNTETIMRQNAQEISAKAKEMVNDTGVIAKQKPRQWLGIILIFLGILFVLDNFTFLRLELLWPFILIAIGLFIVAKK